MEPISKSKHAPGLYSGRIKEKLTICEVHRRLYNRLKDTPYMTDELRHLLEQGFVMGKKMHYRLAKYKHNWSEDLFKENLQNDSQKITQEKPIEWQYLTK